MTTLDRLTQPWKPEGKNTSMQEGIIPGWIPGEITSLDDPEKLGRVRVRSDLLEPGVDLPNVNDGWAWVLEEFVINGRPGGTHRLLKVGTQVAMLPMMGDARYLLVLGCIPSRVDRPHPDLDRSKEVYGSATPNQVVKLHNDRDQSELNAYPHGVTQHISGQGNITYETREHARLRLMADATAMLENDDAYTTHTADGTVAQRSKNGAESILNADGTAEHKSSSAATLKLVDEQAIVQGPLQKEAIAVKEAETTLSTNLNNSSAPSCGQRKEPET